MASAVIYEEQEGLSNSTNIRFGSNFLMGYSSLERDRPTELLRMFNFVYWMPNRPNERYVRLV